MSTRFRKRLMGQRPSTHIEDRRNEQQPAEVAPPDSAGIRFGASDLNRPVPIPRLSRFEVRVPVEKARYDRQMAVLQRDIATGDISPFAQDELQPYPGKPMSKMKPLKKRFSRIKVGGK